MDRHCITTRPILFPLESFSNGPDTAAVDDAPDLNYLSACYQKHRQQLARILHPVQPKKNQQKITITIQNALPTDLNHREKY